MNVVRRRRHSQSVGADPHVIPYTYVRGTNPDRTDVYRNGGSNEWLATFTDNCHTVRVLGRSRTLTEQIKSGLQDDFDRTDPIGSTHPWGNTDSAGRWDIRTGNNSDFPGPGSMLAFSLNQSKRIAPSSYGYDYAYADVTVKVGADHMCDGDSLYQGIMIGYQDVSNHYLATLEWAPSANMYEGFHSNTTGGWGNEDERTKAWSVTGTASDYSVDSTAQRGTMSLGTLNSSRRATVLSNTPNGTVELQVSFPTNPTAGSLWAGPILRYTDISNHYTARLRKNYLEEGPGAASSLDFQKTVAGVTTTIGTVAIGHVNVGDIWNVKADITGTALKAKAWLDGLAEPADWQLEITDASLATGNRFGARSIASPDVSNSLPILVYYHSWRYTATPGDPVLLHAQKRLAGVTTNLVSFDVSGATGVYREHIGFDYYIRAYREGTDLKMKAWREDETEPVAWQIETTDASFGNGDIGLRAVIQPLWTSSLPVQWRWNDYTVDALWDNPPTIVHDTWVYVLDLPFDGTVDEDWLTYKLLHEERDVLSVALEYVSNAPNVYRRTTESFTEAPNTGVPYGTKIAGDSNYGPRTADGSRVAGADFNDYIATDVLYQLNPSGSVLDPNEVSEITSTDCSGLMRLVFGIRNGLPLQGIDVDWTDRIPRLSVDIAGAADSPGVVIFQSVAQPTAPQMALLQIGDIVSFDADQSDPDEEEGQIDHNGIYLGADINGDLRFISARKTVNGPTFSDVGGKSTLNGSGLYARSLRHARRF